MSKEVAHTEPAKSSIPSATSADEEKLLRETAGLGTETVRMADQIVPRIRLLQTLSPELKASKPEYIEGAVEGDFINLATRKIYKRLHLVVASYQIQFIEWKPNRGGLAKNWMQDDSMFRKSEFVEEGEKKFFKTPSGNVMQPTGTYFAFEVSGELPELVVAGLASTQYKHSQSWVTKIMGERVKLGNGDIIRPAPFYRSYIVEPQPETSGKNDWFGWRVTSDVKTTELRGGNAIFNMARELAQMVKSGAVSAEVAEEAPAPADEGKPF
jgi:hypothetical protein